jgi:O-antigen ligase
LFGIRSVGFASEPSWLAHVLNMLYLPYWLSATITGFSAHKKIFKKISIETIFLVFGAVDLFATYSRAGLASFLIVIAFFFVYFNIRVIKKINQRITSNIKKKLITIGIIIGIIAVYCGAVVGVVFVLSKVDERMKDVFSFVTITQGSFTKYASILQFGERVTYWQAGWRIFNAHPIIGVGLGKAGFYFQQMLPDSAWQLDEVRKLVYHSSELMNIKSMWSRLLAETGIVGFSFFLIFLVTSAVTASQLTGNSNKMKQTIGWMGISVLLAFIMEGFSIDSFVLPYLWFSLGLVAATWRWVDRQVKA